MCGSVNHIGMSETRTIGVAVPQTGDMDAIGESVADGARLAASELRDDGVDVALRVENTGGEPDRAAEVAAEMIDDGVSIVVGPISSDVALAVRDVAEDRGVAHLPAMGGNPAITRPGTRYTFRFSSSNRQSAQGSLRFFASEGVERIAVVAADFSYPHAVVDHLREYAPEYGIEVDSAQFTPLGTTDFTPLLDAVDPKRVEGVFLPYPGNNATTLLRQLRETGIYKELVVLGDYSYGSAPYRNRLGDAIEGTNDWGIDTIDEASRRLTDGLGETAGVYHFFGCDVTRIAGEALARVDHPDPEAVRDAVATTDYDAASGWGVRFGESGVNERYQMQVNRWVDLGEELRNLPVFRSAPIVP